MIRKYLLLAAATVALGVGAPARAATFNAGFAVGKAIGAAQGATSVDTSPTVGVPVLLHSIATGATCAWKLNGTANGATSCASYTPSPLDAGKALTAAITLASGTVINVSAGAVGNVQAATLDSSLFTSTTDLTPVSQFIDGWTLDLYLTGLTPANDTTKYNFGSIPGSPKLSFVVTRPGYDGSGNLTTVNDTVYATSWLRKPQPNYTLPTEAVFGVSDMIASLTLSDYVYNSDTMGAATIGAGLYTDGAGHSSLASTVAISGTSSRAYPLPVGTWITEPGRRMDGTANQTVEFYGGQAYGRNGKPLATVKISLNDGVHTTPHFATLAQSQRLLSTSCTATNGSNILTGCTSTVGFVPGDRITVQGIPGQPKIASVDSSTQMTLGTTGTVTTTLNSSTISVTNNTLVNGDGLADGLFVGAKINCSTINGGTDATISAEPTTAGLTVVSSKVTAAPFTIDTSTATAGTNTSCTFKHVYQGTTGAVTVTAGNPVPTWQATFTAAEIAAMNDGAVWFRAQAEPITGDVILDTQTGADGTGVDWQGQSFAVDGSDISPNLHNLFAYKDAAGAYAPRYAWVSGTGTAGGSPATQATTADPGSTAYYASIGAACAGLKTWYNANASHNNANGGVIYVRAGTQAGLGTSMTSCTTKSAPRLTVTYAPADGALSPILQQGGVNTIGPRTTFLGVTYNPTSTGYTGQDSAVTTGLLSTDIIFEQSWLHSVNAPALSAIGSIRYYNDFVEQATADADFFKPFATASTAVALVAGSTVADGTPTTGVGAWWLFNAVGNVTFGIQVKNPSGPVTSANYVQPLSFAVGYNKFMGTRSSFAIQTGSINNLLMANDVIEQMNASGSTPSLQISADSNNTPASNIVRHYETVMGERSNMQYLEGVPTGYNPNPSSTGGALAAGTYNIQVVYALTGTPGVETATDGPSGNITVGGSGAGSIAVTLDKDAYHVVNVYISSVGGGTPNHLAVATIGGTAGVTASGVTTNQVITITDIGAAQAITSSLPGHNELKVQFIQRFSIDENYNMKSDTYNGSGATPSGARVGNWGGRWRVGNMGMIAVTGTAISGPGPGPVSGLGEIDAPYSTHGSAGDLSLVKYRSDRSWGAGQASVTSPALNLGQGNACPDTSTVTTPLNKVPSTYAAWPFDIQGRARRNDGTGAVGAYESGCL